MSRRGCYGHMRMNLVDRFWAKVQKTEGCWLWLGYTCRKGYGIFGVGGGRLMKAHRFSYELGGTKIPEGLQIDHTCRVRHCVNPSHLDVVTNRENVIRGNAARGPQKLCKRGHPLSGTNLHINTRGHRVCRTCSATASANSKRGEQQCVA